MIATGTTTVMPVLVDHDGCDRCGARAQVRVLLRSGGELLFCEHHAHEHGPRLHSIGAVLSRAT
jgi:hypothetical protein